MTVFGLQIAIQSCPVEGDDDDLAAVAVVALLLVFGNVDDGECDCDDMSFLQQDTGTFHLVPVIDGAVAIADEVPGWVVGETTEYPMVDAVHRGEMEGFAVIPVIDENVIKAAAEPDCGIFQVLRLAHCKLRDGCVDRWSLDSIGAENAGLADPDAAGTRDDLEGAVGTKHDAQVRHALFLSAEHARRKLDAADILPWAIERAGDEHVSGAGLTDDDSITAIGEHESGDVVAFAF